MTWTFCSYILQSYTYDPGSWLHTAASKVCKIVHFYFYWRFSKVGEALIKMKLQEAIY